MIVRPLSPTAGGCVGDGFRSDRATWSDWRRMYWSCTAESSPSVASLRRGPTSCRFEWGGGAWIWISHERGGNARFASMAELSGIVTILVS